LKFLSQFPRDIDKDVGKPYSLDMDHFLDSLYYEFALNFSQVIIFIIVIVFYALPNFVLDGPIIEPQWLILRVWV